MAKAASIEQMFSPGVFGRFWVKVKVGREDECWPWRGCTDPSGYGRFTVVGGRRPKTRVASRVAYALSVKDPGGKHVLHRCDNPPCCNPAHLFLGTHADNMRDMGDKGRHGCRGRNGTKHPQAKLSDEDVYDIRARRDAGENSRVIARDYPISCGAVRGIGNRRSWKHLPERKSHAVVAGRG